MTSLDVGCVGASSFALSAAVGLTIGYAIYMDGG
jgi:hypothetical protein